VQQVQRVGRIAQPHHPCRHGQCCLAFAPGQAKQNQKSRGGVAQVQRRRTLLQSG
jgi:hypothetical protein